MLTVCWAAKGGSGTTVVAAGLAINSDQPTLLVDLAGDLPAVLGLPEPDGPGVLDWARSNTTADRLAALELGVTEHLTVLPLGAPGAIPVERWGILATWLSGQSRRVVVDGGSGGPPPASLTASADQTLLVTRPCYLALRAAVRQRAHPSGIVLVHEPGRALGTADIEASIGAPVVSELLLDPAVARAVDAGLLAARLPVGYRRALRASA
jgi:hypothetical protein